MWFASYVTNTTGIHTKKRDNTSICTGVNSNKGGLAMSLKNTLYKMSRMFGKAASTVNDVETVMTGNPEKIAKRFARKLVGKTAYKTANKINRKLR